MRDFTFVDAYESIWGSDASGGAAEMVTCNVRRAGEKDGDDGDSVEIWGQGCIVYRPAKPTEDGTCQLLVAQVGATPVAIASRDLRAAKACGALNDGDAAFCSPTGKVALRCNADGSASLLRQGDTDASVAIEKDGRIILSNEWGSISLGPKGFNVTLANGNQLHLELEYFQAVAPQGFVRCGVVGLGPAPAVPLTFAAASGVAKPCPNILV